MEEDAVEARRRRRRTQREGKRRADLAGKDMLCFSTLSPVLLDSKAETARDGEKLQPREGELELESERERG